VQTLNSLKKKLTDAIKMQEMIVKDMEMKQVKYERTKEDISRAKAEIAKAKYQNKQQTQLQVQIQSMPEPLDFVEQKNVAIELRTSVKNWLRKIEIAEVAAKKARTIIKQAGEYVDDVHRPDFLNQEN